MRRRFPSSLKISRPTAKNSKLKRVRKEIMEYQDKGLGSQSIAGDILLNDDGNDNSDGEWGRYD
jgi:hypothetical protein